MPWQDMIGLDKIGKVVLGKSKLCFLSISKGRQFTRRASERDAMDYGIKVEVFTLCLTSKYFLNHLTCTAFSLSCDIL